MTYTQEAKDLYNTFQDAMGNWNRTPFEHLSTREMEAWQRATGNVARLQDIIDEARQEVRELKSQLEDAEDRADEVGEDLSKTLHKLENAALEIGRLVGLLMEVSR